MLVTSESMFPYFQFHKLEGIGFSGFAFGFFREDVQLIGTKDTLKCFNSSLMEHLHAVIVSGMYTFFASHPFNI